MEETDSSNRRAGRNRRVRLLKKLIIYTILAAILLPTTLCVILFIKLKGVTTELEQLRRSIVEAEEEAEDTTQTGVFVTAQLEESARTKEAEQIEYVIEDENIRKIYLTFDDGPSSNTAAILDILKEYNVKATFFVAGKTDEQSKAAYRRIVEEGHTLGMHSYSHKYQEIYQSVDSFSADLTRLQEYLYEETGVWSRYCRFPGGSSNTVSKVDMQELIAYLNRQNITYFDWNVASGDAASGTINSARLVDNCLAGSSGKHVGIILMHDAAEKRSTVEALPEIIEGLLAVENTQILPIDDDTVPIQHITGEEQ